MRGAYDGLMEAWGAFCDDLKALGSERLEDRAPQGPLDQAAGFRNLARSIPLALQLLYENNDPLNPELMRLFDPLRKQGGDNCDGIYLHAPINGIDTYRVTGLIGTADYVSFVVSDNAPTPWGGPVTAMISGDELVIGPDGSFELFIGPSPHPGNWLRTSPGSYRLLIRQFFADWETENPMSARIDRISGSEPGPRFSAEGLATGLAAAAAWLKDSNEYFRDLIEKWRERRNTFLSWPQLEGKMGNTPGGVALTCYWELPEDEALIVRVRPPAARYWSAEFGNYWWETIDYRYYLSSTNKFYAQLEHDGELIVVLSHVDPGVPNWVNPTGFSSGYSTFRWMGTDDQPTPICEQVKRERLFAHLPKDIQRISLSERREQLIRRRKGALRRFQL